MNDLIREAPLGQLLRYATGNRVFKYPEELPGYQLPEAYKTVIDGTEKTHKDPPVSRSRSRDGNLSDTSSASRIDIEKAETADSRRRNGQQSDHLINERIEAEQQLALERTKSRPLAPVKTSDGNILVDWYTTDDPANPYNWSNRKRAIVTLIICVYTFVVYTASAIYVASLEGVMHRFKVNHVEASLGLSLYVLAYGLGPLLWSPLSEIPVIGRSPVYAATMAVFTILSLPTAMVNNFAGLLVLRFLQGFFGSPCLATGAATMQDMYSLINLPYALTSWVSAAYCGPALGPLLSGFAVTAKGWRWSLWEILWAAGPVFIVMFCFLPETSSPNILLRRAQRLRKLTGDDRIKSQSEIDQKHMRPKDIAWDAIIKPLEITIKDPAIAFVNIYTAIIYGIYYSFFEVFPLVYPVYYGFSLGMVGVVFLCVLVSCICGVAAYMAYLYWILIPDIKQNGHRAQESRLVPALIACIGPTIGLFLFGWTARPDIHWIVCTIGIVIYGATCFVVMQCIFVYVPMSYPQYAASLFAANDFFRSALACGSVLFGRPLYINLGVGKGVSLLGGLSVIGIIGIYVLYFYGAKLRARSRFAI